jgi:uncharacterized protein YjbI with pentapeptide repeats
VFTSKRKILRLYRRSASALSRRSLLVLASLALVLVAISGILIVPRLLYPPISEHELSDSGVSGRDRFDLQNDRLSLQNEARGMLLQGTAGALVVFGLYLTWRQVQNSREVHSTERFIRAVDQLGRSDKTTEVALGGIYGLERVARDSRTDRRSIGEILTAYVRTRADDFRERDNERLSSLLQRAPDVQAAISVLGRGKFADVRLLIEEDIRVLDLTGVDLRKADLTNLDLRGAWMTAARIGSAACLNGDFSHVDLSGADLRNVIANQANFSRAWLHSANCQDGSFFNAAFDGAILQGTDLQGANLVRANLRDAVLDEANLFGASLEDAIFERASADETTVWPDGFDPSAAGVYIRRRSGRWPPSVPKTRQPDNDPAALSAVSQIECTDGGNSWCPGSGQLGRTEAPSDSAEL